jgi:hypothetical protein
MWGLFKGRTRPVAGNHEYETAGAAPYFAYFGARAGTAGQGWYAYDVGTWRVYSLNSLFGGWRLWCRVSQNVTRAVSRRTRGHASRRLAPPLFSSSEHGNNSTTRALWNALRRRRRHRHQRSRPRLRTLRAPATDAADSVGHPRVRGRDEHRAAPVRDKRANSRVRKSTVLGVTVQLKPSATRGASCGGGQRLDGYWDDRLPLTRCGCARVHIARSATRPTTARRRRRTDQAAAALASSGDVSRCRISTSSAATRKPTAWTGPARSRDGWDV